MRGWGMTSSGREKCRRVRVPCVALREAGEERCSDIVFAALWHRKLKGAREWTFAGAGG